ncbi:hypothetical protein KSP40_PGU008803 [Platanthera guangdongensis]|uniref:Uncharacterized protein n=1 Tax=Platanthera guangdongensis TaxID=2320717 RepID=A0ABR2N5B6_9ASPA
MYCHVVDEGRRPVPATYLYHYIKKNISVIEGSQATARQTAELLRAVVSHQRLPYTNQALALLDAVRDIGEQLIAANPRLLPTKTRSDNSAGIALMVRRTMLKSVITARMTPVVPNTFPNFVHSISMISSATPPTSSSIFDLSFIATNISRLSATTVDDFLSFYSFA